MHISEIQIRDPFVVLENGRYYLFGSTDKDIWKGKGEGFDVYVGNDSLDEFDGPFHAFCPPADFWSDTNFWAPEVHLYNNAWFMFATFKPKKGRRGTTILKSENGIVGPYIPWGVNSVGISAPVTPCEWECLDGTFFLEDGKPWMVFCHEWQQVYDGEVCAVPLSDDLRCCELSSREPLLLFRASEAPWSHELKGRKPGSFVTDGPFMYRAEDGGLFMLWSSFGETGNYAIGSAFSKSGKIKGPWVQSKTPIYSADGGHGMLFIDKAGKLHLAIHSPNKTPLERALFVELNEKRLTEADYV